MKKISLILTITAVMLLGACSEWLDIRPKDLRYTADFWKSKEDVEAILATGYSDMRILTEKLIAWGELRGGSIFSGYIKPEEMQLQNFQLTPSDGLCQWNTYDKDNQQSYGLYSVINMANSVLEYAPEVQKIDATYTLGAMQSHQTEAYFMRALMYFYLLRNWREVPLVLEPYIDDSAPFAIAKASEATIIAQIKKDIRIALSSGAAKENFVDNNWAGASKGRATKWALYALMADVCLWNEDYDDCILYCDSLIYAQAAWRPVFMSNTEQWYEIFLPGNSNESIFEINWDVRLEQPGGLYNIFGLVELASRRFAPLMSQRLWAEEYEATRTGRSNIRGHCGTFLTYRAGLPISDADILTPSIISDGAEFSVYKYGGGSVGGYSQRETAAANFIIYRMADVMLMKAEALVWKGGIENWQEATGIVNQIRTRAGLADAVVDFNTTDEITMLETVLHERDMELAAEGKRWYDLLRLGKSKNFTHKTRFIEIIIENNYIANKSWLRSVLKNDWAWYMPIPYDELEVNELLVQNPYYN